MKMLRVVGILKWSLIPGPCNPELTKVTPGVMSRCHVYQGRRYYECDLVATFSRQQYE